MTDQTASCPNQYVTGAYTYEGAPYSIFGIVANREAEDVQLASPYDTLYSTMHAGTSGPWIEVGWLQYGSAYAPTGQVPTVFVAGQNYTDIWTAYPLSSGSYYQFQVFSNDYNDYWTAYIWWNGAWNGLDTLQLSNSATYDPNIVEEEYTNCDGSGRYWMNIGQLYTYAANLSPQYPPNWFLWTPQNFPSYQGYVTFLTSTPYNTCGLASWYEWYSEFNSC